MRRIGPKTPARLFIREWIEHRGLDQRRIAERMECKEGTISKLLSDGPARMRMTMEWLGRFAEALNVEIVDLYRDPNRPTQNDLLSQLSPEKRQQAEDFIAYLARTGTDKEQ